MLKKCSCGYSYPKDHAYKLNVVGVWFDCPQCGSTGFNAIKTKFDIYTKFGPKMGFNENLSVGMYIELLLQNNLIAAVTEDIWRDYNQRYRIYDSQAVINFSNKLPDLLAPLHIKLCKKIFRFLS